MVSVIVPTYNHRDFVLRSLESVFAQTFSDYEIIVVNDGSPDDTADLLRPLAAAGRIRYVEQANAGQAAARNRGLAEARGEFVAFLDDDDLWPPDKLEWQVDILRKSDASMVGGAVSVFRDGEPPHLEIGPKAESLSIDELADGNPFFSPGQTLIRHSALEQVGGFDPTIWGADDFDLYLRLAKHGQVRGDRHVSLYYRLHAGNASNERKRMFLNSYEVVRRHFPDLGSAVSRKAYRWLYEYIGREWVLGARQAIRNMDIRSAAGNLRNVLFFASAALRDFALTKEIFRDLLRNVLWRKLKSWAA